MPGLLTRLFGGGHGAGVDGTLADENLQRDVLLPLRTADRFNRVGADGGAQPGEDAAPGWRIVGAEVVEAPTLPTGPWTERWTVASDGVSRRYLITFSPTSQGTSFSIDPFSVSEP